MNSGLDTKTIQCDSCESVFQPNSINFKTVETKIYGKPFEIVYYACPECGESYVVCMLDYQNKKLRDKYVKAVDSYRKALSKRCNESKLRQKLQKCEECKREAMLCQEAILKQYKDSIPEGILK